jgi:hypothetical protein
MCIFNRLVFVLESKNFVYRILFNKLSVLAKMVESAEDARNRISEEFLNFHVSIHDENDPVSFYTYLRSCLQQK